MANIGAGLIGGAATQAAKSGIAGGLAGGTINGLTDIGKMFGQRQGGGAPQAPGMPQQAMYGNSASDALANYVVTLLNNQRTVK